ncbi:MULTISPECIES: hypothetical protein [Burkholderiaceae]|nr:MULTISPECIES: hypothetical protein [Burkholderiaceae]MCF2133998.1 hypothetical protein [Mycetohabitans sp. B3]MCG1039552.1 hypothetical protein [Mycetohabitans sp. B7]
MFDGAKREPYADAIGRMVCVVLNYFDHAAETNMPVPPKPEEIPQAPGM